MFHRNVGSNGKLYVFTITLATLAYLLIGGWIDSYIFRDGLLGTVGAVLITSATEKYVKRKYPGD